MEQIPLLEFDSDESSITEPAKIHSNEGGLRLPEPCVLPMSRSLIDRLVEAGRLEKVFEIYTPFVPIGVYRLEYDGRAVTVAHPGICAAHTVAAMEELIALGCRRFVACGTAGVLDPSLPGGSVIIPDSALRDEGTSYHYAPPSRYIDVDKEVVGTLESVLGRNNIDYRLGRTWTTDGFYRETRGKVAARAAEGCLTVEMECSAFIAAARFRGVRFGQYLIAADDVSGPEWDLRNGENGRHFREHVFWLSVEACLEV